MSLKWLDKPALDAKRVQKGLRRDFKIEGEIQHFLRSFPASFPTMSVNRLRDEKRIFGGLLASDSDMWVAYFWEGKKKKKRHIPTLFHIKIFVSLMQRLTRNSL